MEGGELLFCASSLEKNAFGDGRLARVIPMNAKKEHLFFKPLVHSSLQWFAPAGFWLCHRVGPAGRLFGEGADVAIFGLGFSQTVYRVARR